VPCWVSAPGDLKATGTGERGQRANGTIQHGAEPVVKGEAMQGNTSADGVMYRFLECTAGQYMTRDIKTVTRELSMRELGLVREV
jgi:hypothetical protein